MRDYTSAFLGLILAGVVMMIIALGLMMTRTQFLQTPPAAFAEKRAMIDQPASAARTSDETSGGQQGLRPKG